MPLLARMRQTLELETEDDFMMTANTVQNCRTHQIERKGKKEYSGHFQCPMAVKERPQVGESVKGHAFERGAGGTRFHLLEAFRERVIDALATTASEVQKAVASTNPAALISVWKNTLETPGSPAIPETTRNAIRIYQRIFYLNSPQS